MAATASILGPTAAHTAHTPHTLHSQISNMANRAGSWLGTQRTTVPKRILAEVGYCWARFFALFPPACLFKALWAPRENKQKTASPKTIQVAQLPQKAWKKLESEGLNKKGAKRQNRESREKNVYTFALKVAKRNNKYLRQYWSPSWWKMLVRQRTANPSHKRTLFKKWD